jgi:hypothetical protein
MYPTKNRQVDVTVILNVWKRAYLDEQLTALLNQSVLPAEIWIIHYENHVSIDDFIEKHRNTFNSIYIIDADLNLKYFGRFSIATNVSTTYTWILDDDIIPGTNWLEKCVTKCSAANSIISCTGRIIPPNNFMPELNWFKSYKGIFYGDFRTGEKNYLAEDTLVDYACNSYFYKTEWIKTFWSIWPVTLLSGEDIHLSATLKNLLNVTTVVLKQEGFDDCGNIKRIYGADNHASWRKWNFVSIRKKVLKYHITEKNWKPISWQ